MGIFKKYFLKYKTPIIVGPIFKLLETATELIIPLLIAAMIDTGVANRDKNFILVYGAIVVGLNVVGIIAAIICQKLAARAAVGIGKDVRYDMYEHINTFSHSELDKFSTASINNRMTHDVDRVQTAISLFIRLVMRAPFLLIGSIIMAITIDWKLSLIFLVVAPLTVAAVFIIMKKTVPLYDKTQKNLDTVGNVTRENLQGARVIRAFNKQDDEEKRFDVATNNLKKSAINVVLVSTMLNPVTNIIINFAVIVVLWVGGYQVNAGTLTTGHIIAFINYLAQISAALVAIANLSISFIKAINCGKRIQEVFDTKPSIVEPDNIEISRKFDGVTSEYAVEYQNVSFKYDGAEKPAFANLSIKVKKGETIGVIGGTGSGKSSVCYMIPRFYDVTSGTVKVDGVDVKDYSLKDLRTRIGIVPQKAVLFTGSLRDNMRWRKGDATDEEIMEAIKIAQAEEFVSELENGLSSRVQAGGKNFSGGQRQRLTIARALVGKPEILIMDDSASALDFATDYKLRKAIRENTDNMTVFIISQRVNTIRNADQIIVLDKGKIVGLGKHEELLENCDVYKEIYTSQTK
ncbi:MAG: ABC transporter ATP-binding protein [Clostridia bacterium]|nr:ABC transporter ATP-binding protein [Clostridia bacterium]